MESRLIVVALSSFFGITVLLSCLVGFEAVGLSSPFPIAIWRTAPLGVIPGGTGLQHCDNGLDPATDLFKFHRLFISPNPPVIGRNVSITALGYFTANVSVDATTFFFINADNAQLVGYGYDGFCNLTRVFQTVSGITRASCPSIAASALLRTDVFIADYWPAGDWFAHVDARNGTTGDDERLFCVEGDIRVRHKGEARTLLRRTREAMLPRSVWFWQEDPDAYR